MGQSKTDDGAVIYQVECVRLFSSEDIQTFRTDLMEIAEGEGVRLAIDLTKVEFISSRGLACSWPCTKR